MLHNTGPYGPNEAPINMGAPVNMNPMSDHMNLAHNMNNLSKIANPAVPPPSGHYNLPDYAHYNHSTLGMPPQMPQFPNYQHLGFQHTYMNQNASTINDLTFPNGMFPMNLNMQNEHNSNAMNYAYDKRFTESVRQENFKEQNVQKMPLNMEQNTRKMPLNMDDSVQKMPLNMEHNLRKMPLNMEHNLRKMPLNMEHNLRKMPLNMEDNIRKMPLNMEHNLRKMPLNMEDNMRKMPLSMEDNLRKMPLNMEDSVRKIPPNMEDTVQKMPLNMEDNVRKMSLNIENNARKMLVSMEENVRKMPLNIPQIPNKSYTKPFGGNNDYMHDSLYQNTDNNLDLSMKTHEKLQIDSTRRKNIEHTVKLIENILINSSNKSREPPPKSPSHTREPEFAQTDVPSDRTIEKSSKSDTTSKDPLALSPADLRKPDLNNDNSKSDSSINDDNDDETKPESEYESSAEEDDVKPVGITQQAAAEEGTATSDNSIVIKVEKASWADTECFTPFLKDSNGFERDEQMSYRIIEGEYSVNEATNAYKNDIKPEGVFECPHCALLFKHPKRFLIHNKWHTFGLTNAKRMEIAKVREQKRFEKKEARIMERINAKDVTDVKVDGKVFPCKDCDKVFSAKGSLKNHRQRTHPTRVRECRICHKAISSWTALRAHIATHSAESGPGYQCSECPKRFKYSHSLAKHSDTHLEKTHACTDCPKKFGSQALLKMHMKTHERVLRGATFRCTYCGKGFFESYSLQVHERTHRNERPFSCDICNTSYGTNSSLKRHLKVSHNTAKPYQCSVCRRNFSTESIRDRHEMRLHADPEHFKFPCKQCDSKYLKLKDLQKHVYKMHPKGKRKKKVRSDSE